MQASCNLHIGITFNVPYLVSTLLNAMHSEKGAPQVCHKPQATSHKPQAMFI